MQSTLDAYPNPFNPSTTIRLALAQGGRVRLQIYDVLGREVETLLDKELSKGIHEVAWNAAGLSSGVYVAKYLVTDELGMSQHAGSVKLVLTK